MGAQAGTTLFTVGGAAIGSYLGGPVGGQIGAMAGGIIGSLIFNRSKKPLIPDLNMMNASYGNPIPIFWGEVLLPGTVLWMSQIQIKSHGLGKGGPNAKSSQPSLWLNCQLGFGESPGYMVKLFLDGKIFIDNTSGGQEATKKRFAIREYDGNESQLPDFLYTQWVQANVEGGTSVPAFRGICSLVFDKIDLQNFGSRLPQVSAIWTNNPNYETTFNQIIRFDPDLRTDLGIATVATGTFAVDWTRNVLYTLSADFTIRLFDLTSRRALTVRVDSGMNGITCGNGTMLYGWAGIGSFPSFQVAFYLIDAQSLNVGPAFPTGQEGHNLPQQAIAFGINSPNGYFEMLVGTWSQLGGGGAFFYGPNRGLIVNQFLTHESVFAKAFCCLGPTDPNTGNTDVYFLNWDNTAVQGLYLIRGRISASAWNPTVPSVDTLIAGAGIAMELIHTFLPTDFGLSPQESSGTIIYDAAEVAIVIQGIPWTGIGSIKYSVDPGAEGVLWTNSNMGGANDFSNVDRGSLGARGSGDATLMSMADGSQSLSPVPTGSPALDGGQAYDSYTNSVVFRSTDGEYYIASLKRMPGGQFPVAEIFSDICHRAGLTDSDIDVTLVDETVRGYAIRDHKSFGAALQDVCHTFLIDMIESDYKIKFIPRGQASVATITQAELVSVQDDDPSRYWVAHLPQETEMPLQLTVKYSDPDLDHQPGSAPAQRTALPIPTVFSKRRMTMDLPVVVNNQAARQIAEKLLYTMWAERETYDTGLTAKYLWIDPADNIVVNMDNGDSYGVRIETQEVGVALSSKLLVTDEDMTTYIASTSPGAAVSFVQQVIIPAPFGQALLFNVPLLQDSDEVTGATRIYFGAGSYASAWLGGGLYESQDGSTWTLLSQLTNAVNWGHAQTILGDTGSPFSTDHVNTVRVAWAAGDVIPASCSYDERVNGANAAVLGSEIIQFQDVTNNDDGTYTLGTLSRGQRGTEWATGTHGPGEFLIMLEPGLIGGSRLDLSLIGVQQQWRLLPTGRFLDQIPIVPFAYLGYDKFPYAPIHFARANSGSDLVLTWVRRTRVGGQMQDGLDTAPLSEETEAYEAYVLPNAAAIASFDPTSAPSYTRKFSSLTTPTVTYTAAEMTTDSFVRATDTLYLVVYQISALVGRGFRGYAALPPF